MARHQRKKRRAGCGIAVAIPALVLVAATVLFFATGVFDSLKTRYYQSMYPRDYQSYVSEASAEFGVEESLIYAVIRTESGFREQAQSHAGAIGLMQLMPDTFSWLQQKLNGEATMGEEALYDSQTNIRYGTYLLAVLLEMYNGDLTAATAAYNAGLSNVSSWLEDPAYSPDGKTLSVIPFEETEQYVSRVLQSKEMYDRLYYQP